MPRTYTDIPEPRKVLEADTIRGYSRETVEDALAGGGSKKIHITITGLQFLNIIGGGEEDVTIPDSESADIDAEDSKNISFIVESVVNNASVDLLLPYTQMSGNVRIWANFVTLPDSSIMYAKISRTSTDEHNVVKLFRMAS